MQKEFEVRKEELIKYHGREARAVIPESVKIIGKQAFFGCDSLEEIILPKGITEIREKAFDRCRNLRSIVLPERIAEIGSGAFIDCAALSSFSVPDGVRELKSNLFLNCTGLTSVFLPGSVKRIGLNAFRNCTGLKEVILPDGITEIGRSAFESCTSLFSIAIPSSVTVIERGAFQDCTSLSSITIPVGVTEITDGAFGSCVSLSSLILPDGVKRIGYNAFFNCRNLEMIRIPDSVSLIEGEAFGDCPKLTVVCSEGSYASRYCTEKHVLFLYDYQYEAFHGLIPQGFERLASPFLADEEKPYIFISYSHRDREEVLPIIKTLYESGWKIWYDEGLTIGDSYDITLENHVRNCSAFLLFVSENSVRSFYCRENEIPWAIQSGKPIIKCILEEGCEYVIEEDAVLAEVKPSEIESALEKAGGLRKGEARIAKGISVVVNPEDRNKTGGEGYAYCLYSETGGKSAKAILLDAKNSGCALYDASLNGQDEERLKNSASLIVFLDKAFLSQEALRKTLIREFQEGKDIAVCQLEELEDADLPEELLGLHRMQWLNFAYGISEDMNTKLARHLQKRGCRNTAILPGFEYEETEEGIVLKKYTGKNPAPWIEREYGGIPVREIGKGAFRQCIHLKTLIIPEGVTKIGYNAFGFCINLEKITLPDTVTEIGDIVFESCRSLTSVRIPEGVKEIGWHAFSVCKNLHTVILPKSTAVIGSGAFYGCSSLPSVMIPDCVREIGDHAFRNCTGLASITLPDSLMKIKAGAFHNCVSLKSIVLPPQVNEAGPYAFSSCENLMEVILSDSLKKIEEHAFEDCRNLTSVRIPGCVEEIGQYAFHNCTGLVSLTIPASVTKIGENAFCNCAGLSVKCQPGSAAWKYCRACHIPIDGHETEQETPSGFGFLGRLFRRK